MTDEIVVLVTGAGGGGIGEQLVKCLKMASRNYTVLATDTSADGLSQSEADIRDVLPPASNSEYTEALIRLCDRYRIKAVFPGSEPELMRIGADRATIQSHVDLLAVNPPQVIDICSDKFKTNEFLANHGFPFPRSMLVQSLQELEAVDFFPAIIKPTFGGGSQQVYLAQDADELKNLGSYLLNYFNNILVQEYVGRVDQEYTVGVLMDGDGEFINSIAVRRFILSSLSNKLKVRNRTDRTDLGDLLAISSGISQGRVGRFPEVTEFCEKLAVALGCRYAVNIQCRLVDGVPYVFEINPRFSGTSSIRALVGFNEPDILIQKHVLNLSVPTRFEYKSGVVRRGLREAFFES